MHPMIKATLSKKLILFRDLAQMYQKKSGLEPGFVPYHDFKKILQGVGINM